MLFGTRLPEEYHEGVPHIVLPFKVLDRCRFLAVAAIDSFLIFVTLEDPIDQIIHTFSFKPDDPGAWVWTKKQCPN